MNDLQTLTPVEAGKLLGIGRCTAYKLIRNGTIPAIRLGKKLCVPRAALEGLLRNPGSLKEVY